MVKSNFEVKIFPCVFWHRGKKRVTRNGYKVADSYIRIDRGGESFYYYGDKVRMTQKDKREFSTIRNRVCLLIREHLQKPSSGALPFTLVFDELSRLVFDYRLRALREWFVEQAHVIKPCDYEKLRSSVCAAFGFSPLAE